MRALVLLVTTLLVASPTLELAPSPMPAPWLLAHGRSHADGGGQPDVGDPDAGQIDAGQIDAGQIDAGQPDVGDPDAGQIDAGQIDAGQIDAGQIDAGQPDVGQPDVGQIDAGQPDVGQQDVGQPDTGAPIAHEGLQFAAASYISAAPTAGMAMNSGGGTQCVIFDKGTNDWSASASHYTMEMNAFKFITNGPRQGIGFSFNPVTNAASADFYTSNSNTPVVASNAVSASKTNLICLGRDSVSGLGYLQINGGTVASSAVSFDPITLGGFNAPGGIGGQLGQPGSLANIYEYWVSTANPTPTSLTAQWTAASTCYTAGACLADDGHVDAHCVADYIYDQGIRRTNLALYSSDLLNASSPWSTSRSWISATADGTKGVILRINESHPGDWGVFGNAAPGPVSTATDADEAVDFYSTDGSAQVGGILGSCAYNGVGQVVSCACSRDDAGSCATSSVWGGQGCTASSAFSSTTPARLHLQIHCSLTPDHWWIYASPGIYGGAQSNGQTVGIAHPQMSPATAAVAYCPTVASAATCGVFFNCSPGPTWTPVGTVTGMSAAYSWPP